MSTSDFINFNLFFEIFNFLALSLLTNKASSQISIPTPEQLFTSFNIDKIMHPEPVPISRIEKERSQDRKTKIGTGDRSERIRTYNFPQGRVTDHRINLTLHKLEEFLEGDAFDEMVEKCRCWG